MTINVYAGLFVCPQCKMPWRSLQPIPQLLIQDPEVLAKGDWTIPVLCTACNHLSVCSSTDFPHPGKPDSELQKPSNYARRIFSITLPCAEKTCKAPARILALSNGAFDCGTIGTELGRCQPDHRLCCGEQNELLAPLIPFDIRIAFEEPDPRTSSFVL
jgi:hypothetical protein